MARRRDGTESLAVVLGRANYSGDCRARPSLPGPTRKAFISIVRHTGKPLLRQTAGGTAGWLGSRWGL